MTVRMKCWKLVEKGRKTNGSVPVVMISHVAKEADVRKALAEIDRLEVVSQPTMLIRIENEKLD